jgi:ligand-binding sensor domain-containing protein
MNFISILFILFFLFSTNLSLAQQPAHFILGENQFKGVKIFDMIQDKKDNYYFATNEGIIQYDFIQFKKLETKEARSESFFNLVINKNGVIFFHNLNNQIFKIVGNRCQLLFTLPDQFSTNIVNLACNDSGQLIIACKGIIILSETGKLIAVKESSYVFNSCLQLRNHQWIFPASNANQLVIYDKAQFYETKLNSKSKSDELKYGVLDIFNFKGQSIAIDVSLKKFYTFDENDWTLKEITIGNFLNSSTNARIYNTDEQLWSASSISGINCSHQAIPRDFSYLFKDYFISNVMKDREGNLLLSTFDKGVIVVPNMAIPDVIDPFQQDPMISIYAINKNEVYLGSHRGQLKSYQNKTLLSINNTNKKPIEGVYGDPQSDYIIYDDEEIKCYNHRTKVSYSFSKASLKDVCFVNSNEIFIGTNVGVFKVLLGEYGIYSLEAIPDLKTRIYSLAYDRKNASLYVSSANGLLKMQGNKVEKILYENNVVFSEKIAAYGENIYILSRQYGILKLNSRNAFTSIQFKHPYPDKQIKNLKFYKNTIIVSMQDGLFQFDQKGNILQQFHTTYGFSNKKIYQYSIAENTLWVSHSGGVQEIKLNETIGKSDSITIRLNEVLVNDSMTAISGKHLFHSDQRKFSFIVVSPSLRNLGNVKFHYQLAGYDPQWYFQTSSMIQFNALSPGNYILRIKAESMGKFSDVIEYTFKIQKPYYEQWWFLLTGLLLFLVIVYYFYQRQVEKQRVKLKLQNELNLSKLTAIQSQMNPHFIFNSLNSIQDFVLQQDSMKAYDAIGKFATLIRKIMLHSEKEFIDIEEELSILHVYLELEMLRIKKDFRYTIDCHGLKDIEIPPMLIQPFIENSIKHGLMHKKGEKILKIDLYIEENIFYCVIEDNGIGRQESGEIRKRQNKEHQSFAGSALEKRMQILKNQFEGDFSVEFVDLQDREGKACGTKVILKAPFKKMY